MSSDQETPEPFQVKIAPWLSVRHGAEAVDYYKAAFGAVELHRVENEEGEIVAQLSIVGADFWVADDPDRSPEVLGAGSVRMILTVEDPETVFERAVNAGASVVAAIYEDHGWRIGRVADPFGHDWEIARPLAPGR